jgi:hypothetical protein
MKTAIALGLLTLIEFGAQAGPRSSASYGLSTDSIDAGGRRSASANYSNDGSAGGVTGVSTVASPAEVAKHGYLGQITEVAALLVSASPTTVNESGTRQLAASQLLDDSSTVALAAGVAWSIQSGPLSGISSGGLVTAGAVFQNTAATVQGTHAGNSGNLNLTVLDTIADNFGAYAGDGLGDDWQVQFFGPPPNANAAPLADPDSDGQNNLFEFTAGLVPTDSTSVFRMRTELVPGQPLQRRIIFSPRYASRSYGIITSTTLAPGSFTTPLSGGTVSDSGVERTVTDTSATGTVKFYRVEITKP